MALQKIDVFFFKRFDSVMLFLISDVFANGFDLRSVNDKRSISFLPFEFVLAFG